MSLFFYAIQHIFPFHKDSDKYVNIKMQTLSKSFNNKNSSSQKQMENFNFWHKEFILRFRFLLRIQFYFAFLFLLIKYSSACSFMSKLFTGALRPISITGSPPAPPLPPTCIPPFSFCKIN